MRRTRKKERGAALLTTLVAIAIVGTLMATVGNLVLGHLARARTEHDAARAMAYAEAALNFQVQKVTANLGKTQTAYNGTNLNTATYGSATVLSTPDANGLMYTGYPYPVHLTTTGTNNMTFGADDYCVCWTEPALNVNVATDIWIYGQARVNGVVRTVRAAGGADNIFNKWALFSNGGMTIGGSLDITPNSTYPSGTGSLGVVGTNSSISISGSANVGAQVVYGSTATPDPDVPFVYGGSKVNLESIDSIANKTAALASYSPNSSGIANFATNNDNLTLATATKTNGQGQGAAQIAIPTNGVLPNNGSYPITLKGKAGGANFYLQSVDGSNVVIKADITAGPVNLWINHTASTGQNVDDKLSGQTEFSAYKTVNNTAQPSTLADAKDFVVYYNNPYGKLQFTGGGAVTMYAMFYAYNVYTATNAPAGKSAGDSYGSVDFTGSATVNGSFIANTITKSGGNFTINFPTNITNVDSAKLLFGLRSAFHEYAPARGN